MTLLLTLLPVQEGWRDFPGVQNLQGPDTHLLIWSWERGRNHLCSGCQGLARLTQSHSRALGMIWLSWSKASGLSWHSELSCAPAQPPAHLAFDFGGIWPDLSARLLYREGAERVWGWFWDKLDPTDAPPGPPICVCAYSLNA